MDWVRLGRICVLTWDTIWKWDESDDSWRTWQAGLTGSSSHPCHSVPVECEENEHGPPGPRQTVDLYPNCYSTLRMDQCRKTKQKNVPVMLVCCRTMYIRHGHISYLSGLVQPRTKEKNNLFGLDCSSFLKLFVHFVSIRGYSVILDEYWVCTPFRLQFCPCPPPRVTCPIPFTLSGQQVIKEKYNWTIFTIDSGNEKSMIRDKSHCPIFTIDSRKLCKNRNLHLWSKIDLVLVTQGLPSVVTVGNPRCPHVYPESCLTQIQFLFNATIQGVYMSTHECHLFWYWKY
jgi:hypothetical protein